MRPELGRSGCRMAHGPVAGGGAIILAHEQSSRAAGMINLETGQVKSYGAQDEKELLVKSPTVVLHSSANCADARSTLIMKRMCWAMTESGLSAYSIGQPCLYHKYDVL